MEKTFHMLGSCKAIFFSTWHHYTCVRSLCSLECFIDPPSTSCSITKAGVIRPSFRRPQFICIFYRWLLLHNLLFIEVDISFPWHPISYGVDGVFVRIECFNLFFLSPSLYTFCNIECVVLAFITKHQLTPKPFLVS